MLGQELTSYPIDDSDTTADILKLDSYMAFRKLSYTLVSTGVVIMFSVVKLFSVIP